MGDAVAIDGSAVSAAAEVAPFSISVDSGVREDLSSS